MQRFIPDTQRETEVCILEIVLPEYSDLKR